MKEFSNQGIIVEHGSTIKAKLIAVGENAHIESVLSSCVAGETKTIEDLRCVIDELVEIIKRNESKIPVEAIGAVEVVAQEVKKSEPNKIIVTSVLDSVNNTIKSFGSIASAVVAVRELASTVLK